MTSTALVPSFYLSQGKSSLRSALIVASGVALISILAQVSLRLPFSVVPITGQTFGVSLLALLYGRKHGMAAVLSYLGLGAIGFPVFAASQAGLSGPSIGYLIGMFVASGLIGFLADRGFTKTFKTAWLASFLGDIVILSFGLFWLSFFIPRETLLAAGLLPFIPGELIKTTLAASIASTAHKGYLKRN